MVNQHTLKFQIGVNVEQFHKLLSGQILAGLSGAYPTLICVTAAYLVIIVGIGSVGLKMKKQPS